MKEIASAFGQLLLIAFLLSPIIWLLLTDKKRTKARQEKVAAAQALAPRMHCMTCGTDFQLPATGALRGSTAIEVVLWIFGALILGLIYSIWRRMGVGKARVSCTACGNLQVVPADSPAARAHRRTLEATAS